MGFFDDVFSPVRDVVGAITGSNNAAEATQDIAIERRADTEKAVNLAQPTAQQLQQIDIMLKNQQQQINFSNSQLASLGEILSQIHPVLAQGFAAQSAALSGQNVGPISRQIDIERQQNLNRQVAGMGTGASSSSAGMAADALFGQQAGLARQQDIANLGAVNAQNASIYGALAGNINNSTALNTNTSNSIFSALGQQQERQVNAQLGLASTAGANWVADLYKGQAQQGLFNTALGAAAGVATSKALR